jgi:hypothetical protein
MPEQQQAAQNNPADPAYVPPTDVVPLPSKGKLYSPGHPLYNAETVEIRAMTTRDEDILTSRALLKQGRAISTLLRSCMVNKQIDPDTMLSGDRNAVLIAIRITGYGNIYTASPICEHCDQMIRDVDFDLLQLPIIPLGAEPVSANSNVFSFQLPVLKREARFKLFTGADEREVDSVTEATMKAAGPMATTALVTTRLLHQIVAIGNVSEKSQLARLIQTMPARDSLALRKYMDKIKPDVDFMQKVVCKNIDCGKVSEVALPMGPEFFWPK